MKASLTVKADDVNIKVVRVYSSVVERAPDKREVGSSILPRPTRDSSKFPVKQFRVRFVAKIERFEEIKAWQLARDLVKMIYGFTNKIPFHKDSGLSNQIQRAAVSIMSNVAEGFGRGSNREFVNFLHIARGSCAEVRSLLYIALDLGYIDVEEFNRASQQAEETSKAISGFVRYLKSAQ